MFEIIDEKRKRYVISLHLEEIYKALELKTHIKEQSRLFSKETLNKSCVDYLIRLPENSGKYVDYEFCVDFEYIKYMAPNTKDRFLKWLQELPNVKIAHCKNFEHYEEIKSLGIVEDDMLDFRKAFNDYGKKYIIDNCRDPQGYVTQTGTELGVYIDLKRIINDRIEMLRWCYIVANDLNNYFSLVDEEPEKKNLFFCHTMNGSYIAGILSQLLGYNLVYVDHLGPYNKLNKVDFYKGKSRTEEFIIIADMICQGNEFLRAKNIVEYMGGTVRGSAGLLKLDISNVLVPYKINVFAINFTQEEAVDELGYTIRTKLCSNKCEECS